MPKLPFSLLLPVLALLALGLPGTATARVVEIGAASGTSALPAPSCPASPCFAVSRATGYQDVVSGTRNLYRVTEGGTIVAWTIRLSDPTRRQIRFFDRTLGGEALAGLTVLRPGKKFSAEVLAQSAMFRLSPFFGQTVQFPLADPIRVRKGQLIGLTVPTWAPALASGQASSTSWRASRRAKQCGLTERERAQTDVGDRTRYPCSYERVRLTYSATLITNPVATEDR